MIAFKDAVDPVNTIVPESGPTKVGCLTCRLRLGVSMHTSKVHVWDITVTVGYVAAGNTVE